MGIYSYQKLVYGVKENGAMVKEYFKLNSDRDAWTQELTRNFRKALAYFLLTRDQFEALLKCIQDHPDGQWYFANSGFTTLDGWKPFHDPLVPCQYTVDFQDYDDIIEEMEEPRRRDEYYSKIDALHRSTCHEGPASERYAREYELLQRLVELNRALCGVKPT
jgi:hypothetical protein